MPPLTEILTSLTSAPPLAVASEYLLFGAAGLITLLAFTGLILAPALGAYGRAWEKAAAAFLSLFVLAALVLVGVAVGVAIVYYWNDITNLLGG
jgi:hypothetical protein